VKVISLHQPWASLFVAGAKLVETRSWQTNYRGPLAVHAAKTIDAGACFRAPFAEALAELGFNGPRDLPLGAVLGTVNLVACLEMVWGPTLTFKQLPGIGFVDPCISIAHDPRLTVRERAFGNYAVGRFAWITPLGPRTILHEPIPLRGFQRIWNLPADVAERLAA